MSGTDRLMKLLALADQGPVMRAALAEEVAELLIDWPLDCPKEMRAPCEALLVRAVQDVDGDTRARLRLRLSADPALSVRVLPPDGKTMMEKARAGEAIAPLMARALDISEGLANEIVRDGSGHALAVAAKAMGLSRADFSALALLVQPGGHVSDCYTRLDAFDAVSTEDASRELQSWPHPHAA